MFINYYFSIGNFMLVCRQIWHFCMSWPAVHWPKQSPGFWLQLIHLKWRLSLFPQTFWIIWKWWTRKTKHYLKYLICSSTSNITNVWCSCKSVSTYNFVCCVCYMILVYIFSLLSRYFACVACIYCVYWLVLCEWSKQVCVCDCVYVHGCQRVCTWHVTGARCRAGL